MAEWLPDPIKLDIPKGWPKPQNIYSKNKLTEQGFQLGRRLFYDGNLSKDGEVSCASCHQQHAAFANYDHDLSHGVENTLTTRNAPALINVAWMKNLHWDGGINHIEVQPLSPLTATNEMGQTLDSVLTYLRKDTSYVRMFREAFGDETINSQRMLKALSQFVGSLVSSNSKYDRILRGEAQFTDYEARGYETFKKNCASCHKEPLFTDNSFRNNGQKLNRFEDIGLMKITQKKEDSLKFKVPTLRNIQLTFPYMHDGRIYSLFSVIDHYRKNIDTTRSDIDPSLRKKIQITDKDRIELVYFLYTLTDSSFIKNPRFAPDHRIILKNPHH
jgi:cytochrome c peroxidase